jgi:cell wall-associated NlpC family hydrolase
MSLNLRRLILLLALAAAAGCAHAPAPALPSPRGQVLSAVQEFLGTPYCTGGADRTGCDCSGLIQAVFARAGLRLPRSVADQIYLGRPVPRADIAPGDALFFGSAGGRATHCGVYLGHGSFAHASKSRGVIVSELQGGYWGERLLAARRYVED